MKCLDNVIYCDNHILVALKPSGWLTQPDDTARPDLETHLKAWVKEEFQKKGAVFLHCVHRIDRPVSGLVLFARTSKALSRLNDESRSGAIQRGYVAEIEGILPNREGELRHYLVHKDYRAEVSMQKGSKIAVLTYRVEKYFEHSTRVAIELKTGRYHQIRAQFAAVGHPIIGDLKYGARQGDGQSIHLHSASLAFTHPVTKEQLKFVNIPTF